ncbi:MAG: SPOR domain-containing protein [Bacteroidales bacterium]|nr:SPOR domain-containing protein [Bacteroidales bacterium]
MQIASYISKLLYSFDCVVIPEFGGFIADYSPARIHPVSHTFYPPSKSILFNPKLTRDDGLLIHNIATDKKVTYEQIKKELEGDVNILREQIQKGEKVLLEKVGILYQDKEGNILFNPDENINFLEDAFGLPTFISPPVVRDSVQRRLEKKFVDRKPVPANEKQSRKINWAYLAIIPVVFIFSWFIFSGGFKNKDVQQSGVVTLNDSDQNNTAIPQGDELLSEISTAGITPLKDLNFTELKAEKTEESMSLLVKEPGPKYYIIGGAFQFEDNAEKLVADLRKKGYTAQRAGQNDNGLFMVCYYNTEDKSEALVNLAIIRRNDNPSAWLLKK